MAIPFPMDMPNSDQMLYDLVSDELKGMQFVIMDKEYFPPEEGHLFNMNTRFMTPDDPKNPPLIQRHIASLLKPQAEEGRSATL